MVSFYLPEGGCSLGEEYLVSLGLGNCAFADGVLRADDYLSDDDIARIETEGFKRADIHWYEITPEPARDKQSELLDAFGEYPSSTIPPQGNDGLRVSFVNPISDERIGSIQDLGYDINKLDTSENRARLVNVKFALKLLLSQELAKVKSLTLALCL